jgi:hypothetical protein
VIRQHSGKIPHTIAVLKKIVESRQDFALRRIEWAAAEFVQAGTVPKQWQLIRHSGTDRVKHWPLVRQTLDRTMTQLQEMNNANQPSALLLAVRDSQIEKISALLREE